MRRVLVGVVLACCAILVVGLALGQSTPAKETKPAEVKGTEYHHLLQLDIKEAVEHAKTLNHYAKFHATALEKDVVMRHVDELAKNLDGVRTEIGRVEQSAAEPGKPVDSRLTMIRKHEELARQDLEVLKAEMAKPKPEATVIEAKSKAIYETMSQAEESHKGVMAKRGVHEPAKPATTKK